MTAHTSTSSPSSHSHSPLLLQHEAHLLELHVLPDDLHLPLLQFLQLLQVDGHLLSHQACTVAAQALPLPRHPLPLLPVVIQEAAQVPQLLVVLLQFLVHVLVYTDTHRNRNTHTKSSTVRDYMHAPAGIDYLMSEKRVPIMQLCVC